MARIMFLIAMAACVIGLTMAVEAVPPGKSLDWDGGGAGKVVFDGTIHSKAGNKCNFCHPKLFKLKRGGTRITMEAIDGGDLCGTCHDGQKAFSAKECNRCHLK